MTEQNPQVRLSQEHGSYIIVDTTDYVRKLNFPKEIDGLKLKTEFHVSLIKFADQIADKSLADRISEANNSVAHFIDDHPPQLDGQFLRAFQPEKDLESIVGLVDILDLEKWRDAIRVVLGGGTDFTVPHITLYTKQLDKGIPLNSQREFDQRTRPLELGIVDKLQRHLSKD